MVMEVIAGVLMLAGPGPGGPAHRADLYSRGWFMNMFEAMILFIRDEVARPAIGGHGADRFLPYLWTVFFFILFNNLLGHHPRGGLGDGQHQRDGGAGGDDAGGRRRGRDAARWGPRASGWGWCPHLDVPGWLQPPLWGLMFVIEIAGLLIRHVVLAVRLFANMFAGHVVLSVILGFILMAYDVAGLLPGAAGEHRRRDRAEPPGAVRRVLASLHLYVSVCVVHRDGRPSALMAAMPRRAGPRPGRAGGAGGDRRAAPDGPRLDGRGAAGPAAASLRECLLKQSKESRVR